MGGSHACVVHTGGGLKCWGYNYFGQLGLGDAQHRGDEPGEMGEHLPWVRVGGAVQSVFAGESHTCALRRDGAVVCWGENGGGQLGRGDAVTSWGTDPLHMGAGLTPVSLGHGEVAAMALGTRHTCALYTDGRLKCWGDNSRGQLGLGDTRARGLHASDMGDALSAIAVPTGLRVRSVAAGGLHTCAIFSDDSLRCWGDNRHGQLGYGDVQSRADAAGNTPASLPPIDLGAFEVAEQVVTSTASTCVLSRHALSQRRSVRCWGDNVHGELGYGDTARRADTLETRPALLAPLALGDATSEPLAITLGWDHACARLSDRTVQCWGDNEVGQLGLGDTQNRGASLPLGGMPRTDLGGTPSAVYAGISHSCATFEDGEVRCWGYNNAGQLGVEHLDAVGDQPLEMGRLLRATALR